MSTRSRILELLKSRGPQSANTLSQELSVTDMAVRQNLHRLRKEGVVHYREEASGVGRPTRIWSLTAQANSLFPDRHAALTVDLLEALGQAFGKTGFQQLLVERRRAQEEDYRARLPEASQPLTERLEALKEIRSQEGYMAELHPTPDGHLLIENHCPICVAASHCQGLCQAELELFQNLLGSDVKVERTEHILSGARRCAYRIQPADPTATDPDGE